MTWLDKELPNPERFNEVREDLKRGTPLNLSMIHYIFGREFFELIVISLVDSKVAYTELMEMMKK